MSNSVESFAETIKSVCVYLFWSIILCNLWSLYSEEPEWSFKNFFTKDKIGVWIEAERCTGIYASVLEEKWASEIFDNIDVKVKLRDSFTNDDDKLDLAYEVKAKLSQPMLLNNQESEVDYSLFFDIKFIDEDGFIILSYGSHCSDGMYSHEKYSEKKLTYKWGETKKEVIFKSLIGNEVRIKIAKNTKKIVYKPKIIVTRNEKVNCEKATNYSEYGFIEGSTSKFDFSLYDEDEEPGQDFREEKSGKMSKFTKKN